MAANGSLEQLYGSSPHEALQGWPRSNQCRTGNPSLQCKFLSYFCTVISILWSFQVLCEEQQQQESQACLNLSDLHASLHIQECKNPLQHTEAYVTRLLGHRGRQATKASEIGTDLKRRILKIFRCFSCTC